MTLKTFQNFCNKHYKTLKFFETLTIILVFLLLFFVVTQHFFLQYKVVLVENDFETGGYKVVKEIIVNGQIKDSIYTIDTTTPEHESQFKFNITTPTTYS